MDGSPTTHDRQVEIEERVREIKQHMPATYKSIQAKADEIGRAAFGLVRKGIAGQPNSFYAIERGRVVGTPFDADGIAPDVAALMVQFNCRSVVMWAAPAKAGSNDAAR